MKEIYRHKQGILLTVILIIMMMLLAGCSTPTDYTKEDNWLKIGGQEKEVDVFFVYPTAYMGEDMGDSMYCKMDNIIMRAGALVTYGKDALAFEKAGNIYAPYYRQASGYQVLRKPLEEQAEIIKGAPLEDITNAFDYYIKNYNKGKPFILAGHSQGSNILIYLLEDYMKKHPEVQSRMVAAYIIGYSVTEEYLAKNPHLKFAQGREDTGVIISYNTEAPKIEGENPVVLEGAISINPISWTLDETTAPKEDSLGSQIAEKLLPVKKSNFADATVDKERGVIICTTVNPTDYVTESGALIGMGEGVYHSYDYPFYFYDLEQNALDRVDAFLAKG